MKKAVRIVKRSEHDEVRQNLEYWLSRPPAERVAAVEALRRQHYGDPGRLQRVLRVVKRSES